MGTNTAIEWADHTWNPWYGCTKVSAGCDNCYMYRDAIRYGRRPEILHRAAEKTFHLPKRAMRRGEWKAGDKVFVCSMGDFFHGEADLLRAEAWAIIQQLPELTFLLLTKRPERILSCLPADWGKGYANVWLGVTAENQDAADRRLPWLLSIPAAKRFVSVEPMIGAVDLTRLDVIQAFCPSAVERYGEAAPRLKWNALSHDDGYNDAIIVQTGEEMALLDWVIVGGETGSKARPMHPAWARAVMRQCASATVPFFFKQWGEWYPIHGTGKLDPYTDVTPDPDAKPPAQFVWLREDGTTDQSGGTFADEALMLRRGRKWSGDRLDGARWKGRP